MPRSTRLPRPHGLTNNTGQAWLSRARQQAVRGLGRLRRRPLPYGHGSAGHLEELFMKLLVAVPVYNEVKMICPVLAEVRKYARDILVINDGSTDGSTEVLRREKGIHLTCHATNLGYGAALRSAFGFAIGHDYDVLITMDSDGQHEASRIPVLLEALDDADLVSGSRYLRSFRENTDPPADRRRINQLLTEYLNQKLALNITDAFCGFKAYRVEHLRRLHITENGYGMPLQLWVQAANLGFRVR